MIHTWWHQAWQALWGHPELLDRTLGWYETVEPVSYTHLDVYKRQVVAYHKILKEVGCSFSRDMYDKEVLRQVKKGLGTFGPVSYTHLDVYKRQALQQMP